TRHDEALSEFGKALEIEPTVTLSARLANPEVQRVFEEAQRLRSGAVPTAETDHSRVAADDASDDGRAESRRALPSASSVDDERTAAAPRARKNDEAADAGDVAASGGDRDGVAGPSFYLGLGLGSGIGWTSGSGEVTDASVPS